jgi:hypothetical protein
MSITLVAVVAALALRTLCIDGVGVALRRLQVPAHPEGVKLRSGSLSLTPPATRAFGAALRLKACAIDERDVIR